jgi:hypothetical protein
MGIDWNFNELACESSSAERMRTEKKLLSRIGIYF